MKIDPDKLTYESINKARIWADIAATGIRFVGAKAQSGNMPPESAAAEIGELIADFNESVQNLIGMDD